MAAPKIKSTLRSLALYTAMNTIKTTCEDILFEGRQIWPGYVDGIGRS